MAPVWVRWKWKYLQFEQIQSMIFPIVFRIVQSITNDNWFSLFFMVESFNSIN
jgi:hypothetical protein